MKHEEKIELECIHRSSGARRSVELIMGEKRPSVQGSFLFDKNNHFWEFSANDS